jgi:hypothetical protein
VTSRRWALSGQRLRLAEAKEPPPAEFGWSVLGLKRGNGLRIESFDDEPDAKRKLEERDRKCAQSCQGAVLSDGIKWHGEVADDE